MTEVQMLSEIRKIQYFYKLKREIRYAQNRVDEDLTESVAEHIYGMHILAMYFLPLEDKEEKWDRVKIFSMITLHDIDEIENGDVVSNVKTKEMILQGEAVLTMVVEKSPQHIQPAISSLMEEYTNQSTIEARFVKAIDRIEPAVHLFNDSYIHIVKQLKFTENDFLRLKDPYVKEFPIMYCYLKFIYKELKAGDYFYKQELN